MGQPASTCCCNNGDVVADEIRAGKNTCPGQPHCEEHTEGEYRDAGEWPPSLGPEGVPKDEDVLAVQLMSRGQNDPAPEEKPQEEEARQADEASPEKVDANKGGDVQADAWTTEEKEEKEEKDKVGELTPITPKKNAQQTKAKMLRRNLTTQAAGHGGDNIMKDWSCADNGIPRFIIKAYDETEANNYLRMQQLEDPIVRFTPHYDGEVEEEDGQQAENKDGKPQRYMRLSNLLLQFQKGPHVMDCKLGLRSFTESEVSSKALREDLYKKMKELAPNELTSEENEAKAITKHRWMSFNDNFTSLASLGFRIDGICFTRQDGVRGEVTKKDLKCVRTNQDCVKSIVSNFLPTTRVPEESHYRAEAAELILEQLKEMRQAIMDSKFMSTHSLVGSSLLFVADAQGPKADVFLIDFAKTKEVPADIKIDHMSPWEEGNHEDGVLLGIDNMIKVWTQVLKEAKPAKKFWMPRLWR